MENEPEADAQQSNTENRDDSASTNIGHTAPRAQNPTNKTQKWYAKPIRYTEEITFKNLIEGLAFGLACIGASIYYGQLEEMRNQTRLLDEQATRSTITNIGNAAAVDRQLRLLQEQTKAAQSSVLTVQKQFQLEQRPIVTITEITLVDGKTGNPIAHPTLREPVVVNVRYKNVGRTPALGFRPHYHMLFESQWAKIRADPPDKIEKSYPAIMPNTPDTFITIISIADTYMRRDIRMNPADVIGWDGTPILIFGRFSYSDQFGTVYCLPYMRSLLDNGTWAETVALTKPFHFATSQLCPANEQ